LDHLNPCWSHFGKPWGHIQGCWVVLKHLEPGCGGLRPCWATLKLSWTIVGPISRPSYAYPGAILSHPGPMLGSFLFFRGGAYKKSKDCLGNKRELSKNSICQWKNQVFQIGAMLGHRGPILGLSWVLLGPFWVLLSDLGRPWDYLGPAWSHLGLARSHLCALAGPSWA
jgi:hypothetical protein